MESTQHTDSDKELLRRFAEDDEETAFGRLVDRHAAMVRGVALRCTGDAALSDEVAQSVFFLLARRADSVPTDHLAGWLHRTALLTARNARRNSLRYKQALRDLGRHHAVMTDASNSDARFRDSPWEAIRPYLDEAVARLPDRAREPLMLRFFERRSIQEIASQTGKSEAAVRKVLERSLHRLSGMLRRRGIVTNGTALGAVLSAQTLLAPPASATALAVGALSASTMAGTAAGPSVLLSNPLHFLVSSQFLKIAGLALLLASAPAAWLWRQNNDLRRDLRVLGQNLPASTVTSQLNLATTPTPKVVIADASAQPKEKTTSPAVNAAKLKEKSAKEASRELARMSQYLSGLTDDQRARILAIYEERSTRHAEAFEQARQSGAFTRLTGGNQNLTAEDKALLKAVSSKPAESTPENDPLQSILTGEQYARHLEAIERRRISDAEGVASDMLRTLGRSFDLTHEQKDAIFQAVAQFELTPPKGVPEELVGLPFGAGPMDELREGIIREHLSPDQRTLFDQKLEDDRQRREHFMQMMSGASPAGGQ